VWGLPMAMKFMFMLLFFPCIALKLKMYEMGVPRGCLVVLCLGCRVEFGIVFGGKTLVAFFY
jgi:hypothetical protein